MKKILALLIGLSLFIPANANAAISNDTMALNLSERYTATPVDWETWCGDCVGPGELDFTIQEPWTINPGWVTGYTPPIIREAIGGTSNRDSGCMFDSDDWFEYKTDGSVFAPNSTLTATECYWRGVPRWVGGGQLLYIRFNSTSPDIIINAKWDWGAGSKSYTVTPTAGAGRTWNYNVCLVAPEAPGGTYIPVTGSHDGSAIWEVATITITNPTNRKISKTGGFFGTDYRENSLWCPGGMSTWIEV